MELGKTLYAASRKAWRAWLAKHHSGEKEIWLVHFRKRTGRPRIPYQDAVEEALCFGWIDSIQKRVDDDSYAQRFSPRKNKTGWSQPNIERMRRLIRLGKMTPAGLAVFKTGLKQELWIAPDVLKALKRDGRAWGNFQKFPESYKRIRIAFIEAGRRHGRPEFQKRLRNFAKKTKENKRFAFGGVR